VKKPVDIMQMESKKKLALDCGHDVAVIMCIYKPSEINISQ